MPKAVGYVMNRGLGHESQNIHHAVGDLAGAHGLFDEFGQTFFRADARPQALC